MAKQNLTPRINRLESNIVIDGGHEIWPEGTSRTITSGSSAYGAVLFQYNNVSSSATVTNSRQSSVPSGTNLTYSNQVSKTVAGTLAAGTRSIMHYHIEGYDLQRIWNNEFTLIFWVKSSVASNRSVSLRNASASHSYVQQYNIAAANTWELKTMSFPAMSSCPGTVNRDSSLGAIVGWDIVTGSTYQTSSLNQWVSGNFSSGTGEDTTWLTGTNHDFSIAGVMVLSGNWTALTASGYNFIRAGRHFQEELAKTERYFEKSYDLSTAPGTVTANGIFKHHHFSASVANDHRYMKTQFKTRKRAAATVTVYSQNGAVATATNFGPDTDFAASSAQVVAFDEISFNARNNTGGALALSTNQQLAYHWLADARF